MAFIGPELHTLGGLGSFMDATKTASGGSTDGEGGEGDGTAAGGGVGQQ